MMVNICLMHFMLRLVCNKEVLFNFVLEFCEFLNFVSHINRRLDIEGI
jgi:hypothetical protein